MVTRLVGGASKGWYGAFETLTERTASMGIAAGGLIKQYIQQDNYRPDSWDTSTTTVIPVQILDAAMFEKVTGIAAPACPISSEMYKELGFPFFDIPEPTSSISGNFSNVKSLGASKSLRDLFFENNGDVEQSPSGPRMSFRTLSEMKEQLAKLKLAAARGWRCENCGRFMEHEWWTCSKCGKLKSSSSVPSGPSQTL